MDPFNGFTSESIAVSVILGGTKDPVELSICKAELAFGFVVPIPTCANPMLVKKQKKKITPKVLKNLIINICK